MCTWLDWSEQSSHRAEARVMDAVSQVVRRQQWLYPGYQ